MCRIKPHCEVSNALKKWHIAYHGTSVGALRRTLDHSQLLPGEKFICTRFKEVPLRKDYYASEFPSTEDKRFSNEEPPA